MRLSQLEALVQKLRATTEVADPQVMFYAEADHLKHNLGVAASDRFLHLDVVPGTFDAPPTIFAVVGTFPGLGTIPAVTEGDFHLPISVVLGPTQESSK